MTNIVRTNSFQIQIFRGSAELFGQPKYRRQEEHSCSIFSGNISQSRKSLEGCEMCSSRQQEINSQRNDIASTISSTFDLNQELDSLAKSTEPGSAQKAETMLFETLSGWNATRLENKSVARDICPDRVSFNIVLNAWARSREQGSCEKAEQLLQEMQQLHETKCLSNNIQPNTISYSCVINSLAKSGRPERAEAYLQQMHELYDEGKRPDVRPNLKCFNAVLDGWSKSSQAGAAPRAEAILQRMQSISQRSPERQSGYNDVRPDTVSFTSVIDAWSKTGQYGAAERAEVILWRMQELYKAGRIDVQPNTRTFTAVIDAWARSAAKEPHAVERAERLLSKMEEMHQKEGNLNVRPDTRAYTAVIQAHAKSGHSSSAERAMMILRRMQSQDDDQGDNSNQSSRFLRPNVRTYTTVINCIAKSNIEGKAMLGYKILKEMEEEFTSLRNDRAKPDVSAYTAAMNACGYQNGNTQEKREASKVLLSVMSDLRDNPNIEQLDSQCYATFLKGLARSMSFGDHRRDSLTFSTFHNACQEGLVNQFVLDAAFRASPALEETVASRIPSSEEIPRKSLSMANLPTSWSKNASSSKSHSPKSINQKGRR
jgi:pentatricopeptide repeat protein